MEEEIIEVNGLNVTECTHLSDCLFCDYAENHSQFCSDYDNCYYKQLKRLEQENEELKEQIKSLLEYRRKSLTCQECYDEGIAISKIKIKKYKHALKEIKGTIKHFKTYFSEKELNKVKFNDITVIEEIIAGVVGE